MTDRILFVHAGGSKTGSTALQNFFEHNFSLLVSFGFAYENRLNINSDFEVTSGNGRLLHDKLNFGDTPDNEIDRLVLSYFGRCNNAICSSEFFQLTQGLGWRKLFEASVRLGVTLKVIFYVRNIIPFFLSSYDQSIKTEGQCRLFDEWMQEVSWQHFDCLQIIADELPHSDIKLIHFDSKKTDLIRSFLDVLGIDSSFEVSQKYQKNQVNRSLNKNEREALIKVNKVCGNAYSKELSNRLIYKHPYVPVKRYSCNKMTIDVLFDRFKDQMDWVNNTFFKGQSVVSVFPMESEKNLNQNPRIKPMLNSIVEKQVLDWVLEKLKTIKIETELRALNALKDARAQNALGKYPPEIPADFDALAYLLLNPDVLHAGFDPIQHYILYGKEEGRDYKILKKQSSMLHRFNKMLDRLMTAFFKDKAGLSVLLIEPIKKILSKKPITKSAHNGDVEKRDMDWALEQLEALRNEGVQSMQQKINVLIDVAQNASEKVHSNLPDDFDALAYLVLNPDVLHAGCDPIQHYILHGMQKGRVYKFKRG